MPSEQLTTSVDSPDSLPPVGYTVDQLASYIYRSLGAPVWNIELTKQQVLDAINDALALFSLYRPRKLIGALRVTRNVKEYLVGVDMGLGITEVDFVETLLAPTQILGDAFFIIGQGGAGFLHGLDEYDMFLRWRKTWQRVASSQADWYYDDDRRVLLVHNASDRYHAGIRWDGVHQNTKTLSHIGAQWVKEFALAKARYTYGEVLMKFSGAVPGPLKDIQLDSGKRAEAKEEITRLTLKLQAMQIPTPIMID